MNYKAAVKYIRSFLSYEDKPVTKYDERNYDLEKMRRFMKEFGVDYNSLKYIHVGGSKGKGSVCTLIAGYLKEAGYKTGLFISPYVFDIRESIEVNGKFISKEEFTKYVEKLKKFIGKNSGRVLTYFELLTVMAFQYFIDKKVNYAVMEVGLGGRLDSTNVITPEIAVISTVEKEHADILGNTLSKILSEKLGIVKAGVSTVVGYQSKEAERLIKAKLKGKSEVFFVEKLVKYEVKQKGMNLFLKYQLGDREYSELKMKFPSRVQAKNGAVAILTLEKLFGKVDHGALKRAFAKFKLIGRFEVKTVSGHKVVFDMAHTAESVQNLLDSLKAAFPKKKFVFLVSIMKDKNAEEILKLIGREAEKAVFTFSHEQRSIKVLDLVRMGKKYFKNSAGDSDAVRAYKNLLKGLKKDRVLVVTGSHFLIRKVLLGKVAVG